VADNLKNSHNFEVKDYDPVYRTLVHLHLSSNISRYAHYTSYFSRFFSSFCLRSRHECQLEAPFFFLATWSHDPSSQK